MAPIINNLWGPPGDVKTLPRGPIADIQSLGGTENVDVLVESGGVGVRLEELVDEVEVWAGGAEGDGFGAGDGGVVVVDEEAFGAGAADGEGGYAVEDLELVGGGA